MENPETTRKRRGRYITTIIEHNHNISEFHEVDNLNTKPLSQAEDHYEKVFITIRDALQSSAASYCCDDEEDRLNITQIIADLLKKNRLIRKEK